MIKTLVGDCREVLKTLPEQSVHCCICSPPYYNLRDYQTAQWNGGDSECDHKAPRSAQCDTSGGFTGRDKGTRGEQGYSSASGQCISYKTICKKCGAIRQDNQIGLESTPNEYISNIVDVFRNVKRVLRDDGLLFVVIGDSYAANRTYQVPSSKGGPKHSPAQGDSTNNQVPSGCKPKDLIGVPWMLAFALRDDGWYLRSDTIWAKGCSGDYMGGSVMPESVKDRCTRSHEYIFMLSKQPKYYYDYIAIQEQAILPSGTKAAKGGSERSTTDKVNSRPPEYAVYDGKRNRRSVWVVGTEPSRLQHYASYPQALVLPMLLAGCPSQCCPVCGKGWEPIIEKEISQRQKNWTGSGRGNGCPAGGGHKGRTGQWNTTIHSVEYHPSCSCNRTDSIPGTVIDPFAGSGTTGIVAAANNRNAILIDLNPEYITMAQDRGGLFSQER